MSTLDPKVTRFLESHKITYKVLPCDPALADTAAFCKHYGYSPEQAANTIIVASRKVEPTRYAACVVLATTKLDVNKKVCQLMGVKKASFASAEQTMELTGQTIGGVTAFGLPQDLPIYIDAAVMDQPEIILGGGNRSTKLLLNPKELKKQSGLAVIFHLAKSVP